MPSAAMPFPAFMMLLLAASAQGGNYKGLKMGCFYYRRYAIGLVVDKMSNGHLQCLRKIPMQRYP